MAVNFAGLTPELVTAVSKIMHDQDLIAVAGWLLAFAAPLACRGSLATSLQPNHPRRFGRPFLRQAAGCADGLRYLLHHYAEADQNDMDTLQTLLGAAGCSLPTAALLDFNWPMRRRRMQCIRLGMWRHLPKAWKLRILSRWCLPRRSPAAPSIGKVPIGGVA